MSPDKIVGACYIITLLALITGAVCVRMGYSPEGPILIVFLAVLTALMFDPEETP